jgi:hypothetical protein
MFGLSKIGVGKNKDTICVIKNVSQNMWHLSFKSTDLGEIEIDHILFLSWSYIFRRQFPRAFVVSFDNGLF